jgi:hypothetical protein|tara:strand:- start:144 stop:518 length:375 start_codon:yes stop_codon:yes gene_type:complete
MKRLIILIACLLALPAYAQDLPTTPNGVYKLPTFIDCGSSEAIAKVMKRYNTEIPFAKYKRIIMIPPGQLLEGETVLFIDPKSGSWTEIFAIPNEAPANPYGLEKCITGFGTGFKPYSGNEKQI